MRRLTTSRVQSWAFLDLEGVDDCPRLESRAFVQTEFSYCSGSQVMASVMSLQQGWKPEDQPSFEGT
jgi:hypothetical protein